MHCKNPERIKYLIKENFQKRQIFFLFRLFHWWKFSSQKVFPDKISHDKIFHRAIRFLHMEFRVEVQITP